MPRILTTLFSVLLIGSLSQAFAAEPIALTGQKLKKAVSGQTFYLATPFGSELPIKFRSNGTMTGYGKKIVHYISKTAKKVDSGVWWVKRDKVCQRWRDWMGGKSYCYRLRFAGKTVYWRRNDGRSGTARLGR